MKQPSQVPIEITDSSESDTSNDLYASDSGHGAQHQPEAEQVEGPSDEIMLTLQNLSDLSIQSPKAGVRGHIRGPPFRRSQLRKSFLKRCEAEGIPIKGGKMREPEITYVYRTLGSENTFRTAVKHWGCPLCDTYSNLETQQVLERHLTDKDGGHPEVKVEMRKENVSLVSHQPRPVCQRLDHSSGLQVGDHPSHARRGGRDRRRTGFVGDYRKTTSSFLAQRSTVDPSRKSWRFSPTPLRAVSGKHSLRLAGQVPSRWT